MVWDRETFRKCGFFNLNTLGSASDIPIEEATLPGRFSVTYYDIEILL